VKVTITQDATAPVASVAGDIAFETAGALMSALRGAVPNAALGLVLDLRDIDFLDSTGVGVLFELARRLARREQRLDIVVCPDSFASDMLRDVAFAAVAVLHSELPEAIGELHALARP
jgi:anti-anti-sigma factor